MKEYIEREAVEKMLEEAQIISDGEYAGYCTEDVNLDSIPAADVAPVRYGRWKYYHKQNKAVCTCCSFERDLGVDFGRAVACPNCGALMDGKKPTTCHDGVCDIPGVEREEDCE